MFHADFDLPMARVLHTDCPHYGKYAESGETEDEYATRLAKNLETMIEQEGPDTIAAFIAEPVMGAGGVLIPPKTYFAKVQALLAKHDIAFIADEVICGFARTGNWWGSETFGITPTTVTMAKAITSAYVPMGAVTVSEPVYQGLLEESGKQGVFATASHIRAIRWPAPWRSRPSRSTSASRSWSTCSAWRRSSSCG